MTTRLRTFLPLLSILLSVPLDAAPRVVHVLVALCDNEHQGIVPVPKTLGNGRDPAHNLYWGAAFGVRTYFTKSADWKRCGAVAAPGGPILERLIWKHATADVYLVADAYDGARIATTVEHLLRFAGGNGAEDLTVDGVALRCGGAADLVAYVGHDGLMDFAAPDVEAPAPGRHPEVVVLACMARSFFAAPLTRNGAHVLLWTTGLMAPEAYTLKAALDGWVAGEDDAAVRERAAQAYARYQKCGITAARRLLVTGP